MFNRLYPKNRIETLIIKYSVLIREKAISKAKVKIAYNGKNIRDFTEEQLEIIVAEEEIQIKNKIRKSIFISMLALFGIVTF